MSTALSFSTSVLVSGDFIPPREGMEKLYGEEPGRRAAAAHEASLMLVRRGERLSAGVARRPSPSLQELALLSDEDLMAHVAEGCQDALGTLYERYRRLVHSIAFRIVHDSAEADEVVQIVFLDMFRAAAKFSPSKGAFKVWMLQYAYHRALHRKRHLTAARFYANESLQRAGNAGTSKFMRSPDAAHLAGQLLAMLKPRQRAVVELTYFEGLTAQEISDRLQESVYVVRHELYRTIGFLRKCCGQQVEVRS